MKSKRIRQQLVASVLPLHENPNEDKHVESLFIPCLDEVRLPPAPRKTDHLQFIAKEVYKQFTLFKQQIVSLLKSNNFNHTAHIKSSRELISMVDKSVFYQIFFLGTENNVIQSKINGD